MSYEFKAVRRVEFSDTDMAGIMHFSNFFRFMETAEHGFFRSLGMSIINDVAHRGIGWPRVRAECQYKAPLKFQDEVEIQLLVAEKKSKSIRYIFKFRKLNDGAQDVAQGSITVVCVTHRPGVKMKACAIPAGIARKIETAPAHLLQ